MVKRLQNKFDLNFPENSQKYLYIKLEGPKMQEDSRTAQVGAELAHVSPAKGGNVVHPTVPQMRW